MNFNFTQRRKDAKKKELTKSLSLLFFASATAKKQLNIFLKQHLSAFASLREFKFSRAIFMLAFLTTFLNSATAQTQKEDGTWWDNNLEFKVLYQDIDSTGELMICIAQIKEQKCVENLTTGYQVKIYDASNKEIWNSLWTGKNLDIKFKKSFPDAAYLTIEANKNYVVNTLTATRIYQDKALFLKYNLL